MAAVKPVVEDANIVAAIIGFHQVVAGLVQLVVVEVDRHAMPIDPLDPASRSAEVAFTVATYGINVPGTVYRMDDVPIPLRPAFESPHPSDYDLLVAIENEVKERKNIQQVET